MMRSEGSFSNPLIRYRDRRWGDMYRAASMGILGLATGFLVACSPLEPLVEREVSDLQLTVDTLKTSLRDGQRTIAELRAEIDSRRQELADLQIARAQLEGRVREAERRLTEARHVIELQREELAGSRSERKRAARTGTMLESQLKELQKQIAKMGTPAGTGMAVTGRPPSRARQGGTASAKLNQPDLLAESADVVVTQAVHRLERASIDRAPVSKPAWADPLLVTVKPGDTLWSIAQRHRVSLKRLTAMNQLAGNHIQVGQVLWLADPSASDRSEYEAVE